MLFIRKKIIKLFQLINVQIVPMLPFFLPNKLRKKTPEKQFLSMTTIIRKKSDKTNLGS